jgi:hypothetical protein
MSLANKAPQNVPLLEEYAECIFIKVNVVNHAPHGYQKWFSDELTQSAN